MTHEETMWLPATDGTAAATADTGERMHVLDDTFPIHTLVAAQAIHLDAATVQHVRGRERRVQPDAAADAAAADEYGAHTAGTHTQQGTHTLAAADEQNTHSSISTAATAAVTVAAAAAAEQVEERERKAAVDAAGAAFICVTRLFHVCDMTGSFV